MGTGRVHHSKHLPWSTVKPRGMRSLLRMYGVRLTIAISLILIATRYYLGHPPFFGPRDGAASAAQDIATNGDNGGTTFSWADLPLHFPVPIGSMAPLPPLPKDPIPRIQHKFEREDKKSRTIRKARLAAVKSNFTHAWNGYKTNAWLKDEVNPLTGGGKDVFGGWAATLVDALDTLWIMGLHTEFKEAVNAIDKIDFSSTPQAEINVFETTIRYLGGFLSAYDLSNHKYPALLRKAVELGDMLYVAFDTPSRMPITRWKVAEARARNVKQEAPEHVLVSEIGTLTLEFTRLSQLTGNPKYYDAVQLVMDVFARQQDRTKLPGMWPVAVNARKPDFTGDTGFTIGGMSDSVYEYLPKEYLLLGGAAQQYRDMYVKAMGPMKRNIFFRPMAKPNPGITPMLLPGDVKSDGKVHPNNLETVPRAQHLSCFAGGMVALASKIFGLPEDMDVARQLVEGCLWGYESAPAGLMPEVMHVVRCPDDPRAPGLVVCRWFDNTWREEVVKANPPSPKDKDSKEKPDAEKLISSLRLAPGWTFVDDRRYILRPEAIESVFILYRLTGDVTLMDRAWAMFEAIVSATQTEIAHAALGDCTAKHPEETRTDSMESFWLAETLKYFYLMFEDPGVVSLDEYVLNTEAHPLRRPT